MPSAQGKKSINIMRGPKEKISRRLGSKLFLKGDRSLGPKSAIVRKPYPPGLQGKRRRRPLSEYGRELREKQKLRHWYNLQEKQFKNYVDDTLRQRKKVGDASGYLIQKLESRLDNVVYKLGLATSRNQSRQLVNHGHFLVNGKKINIPSCQLVKGDKINVRPKSLKNNFFKIISVRLKNYEPPVWLEIDKKNMEGKVIGQPSIEDAAVPVEITSVFEFYTK